MNKPDARKIKQLQTKYALTEEDYTSEEFLMIIFSLLEMKGYTGFLQLLSVVDDPTVLLKILRLMHGMQFKVPTLQEFSHCLELCVFIFTYATNDSKDCIEGLKYVLNISEEERDNMRKEFDQWAAYLKKNGYKVSDFLKFNNNLCPRDSRMLRKLQRNGW